MAIRFRVLRHQHEQRQGKQVLDALRRDAGELPLVAAAPTESLDLQDGLYARLKDLRENGRLRASRHATAGEAVGAVMEQASQLGGELLIELYDGSGGGSGFFVGSMSFAFLLSCLERWPDGFSVVRSDLSGGVVLDVVLDDPVDGDFYEVERWP